MISVARLLPAGPLFLEATGQVFRGDSGDDLFKTSTRGDLSYVGHLRAYHDITESTNVDLGASYSRGHNAAGLVDGVDVHRSGPSGGGARSPGGPRSALPDARPIFSSAARRGEAIDWTAAAGSSEPRQSRTETLGAGTAFARAPWPGWGCGVWCRRRWRGRR